LSARHVVDFSRRTGMIRYETYKVLHILGVARPVFWFLPVLGGIAVMAIYKPF